MNQIVPLLAKYIENKTIVCPICKSSLIIGPEYVRCENSTGRCSSPEIPVLSKKIPILVDFNRTILDKERLLATDGDSLIRRTGNKYDAIKRLFWGGNNKTKNNLNAFLAALPRFKDRKSTVLIVGGGAIGSGAAGMYDDKEIEILSFDIYASQNTHFVADGHNIPVANDSIDGVWIQAVLEHVLYPQQVVAEIYRVLRPNGIVYAETPFQQHVHEGAYDFTRFTESGHRLLFKDFRLIDSNFLTGIGTVLLWNIRYAAWGISRSKKVAILTAMAFSWIRIFDALVPASFNVDTASGVYFLGLKDLNHSFTDMDIIKHYKGFQNK